MALVLCDCRRPTQPSFAYVLHYSVIVMRMPDFIGHVTVALFSQLEATAVTLYPSRLLLVKLASRVAYFLVVQVYFNVLYGVCARMGARDRAHRFLFVGQVYYYMLWYMVIAVDDGTSWLFWAMLLLMNVNYVMDALGWSLLDLRLSGGRAPRGVSPSLSWIAESPCVRVCVRLFRQPWALCHCLLSSSSSSSSNSLSQSAAPWLPTVPDDCRGVSLSTSTDVAVDVDGLTFVVPSNEVDLREIAAATDGTVEEPGGEPCALPTPHDDAAFTSPCVSLDTPPWHPLLTGSAGRVVRRLPGTLPVTTPAPGDTAPSPTGAKRDRDDLLFRVRAAEQDTLADVCCLCLVPAVLTALYAVGDTAAVRPPPPSSPCRVTHFTLRVRVRACGRAAHRCTPRVRGRAVGGAVGQVRHHGRCPRGQQQGCSTVVCTAGGGTHRARSAAQVRV